MEILEQKRTVLTNTLCLIGMRVRYTVRCSVCDLFRCGVPVVAVVAVQIPVLLAIGGMCGRTVRVHTLGVTVAIAVAVCLMCHVEDVKRYLFGLGIFIGSRQLVVLYSYQWRPLASHC